MFTSSASHSQVPIELHVPDFQKAYDFYKLFGFQVQWMDERYMVLKNDWQLLCFYGGDDSVYRHSYFRNFSTASKRGYGIEVILFAADIENFYSRQAASLNVAAPLKLRPWGKKDFRVEDPFGYYLRISEPYDIANNPAMAASTPQVMEKRNFKL